MFRKITGALIVAAFSMTTPQFAAMADDGAKRGGTLIWAIQNTPRHLNPAVQSGIATGEPGTQLFAAPLRYDEDWTPQPYLAESWSTSADGMTVTLNLVKGATFHDGAPITSSDVAFSIKTVQENHPFKTMFAPVTSVETPDAHTAVIKLNIQLCFWLCHHSFCQSFQSMCMAMVKMQKLIQPIQRVLLDQDHLNWLNSSAISTLSLSVTMISSSTDAHILTKL